jgi:hypothetical protein
MGTLPTSVLDGTVCGGRVFEAEAVKRQPSMLADPEAAVFDRLADVRGGGGNQFPADRLEEDELIARVDAHVAPHVQLNRAPPSFA